MDTIYNVFQPDTRTKSGRKTTLSSAFGTQLDWFCITLEIDLIGNVADINVVIFECT